MPIERKLKPTVMRLARCGEGGAHTRVRRRGVPSKSIVRLRVARIPIVSSIGGKDTVSSTVTPKNAGAPSTRALRKR